MELLILIISLVAITTAIVSIFRVMCLPYKDFATLVYYLFLIDVLQALTSLLLAIIEIILTSIIETIINFFDNE